MTSGKAIKNTFHKKEKLCSNVSIEHLFRFGKSFVSYPLRVIYYIDDSSENTSTHASVLISVSKKKFKRAVKRNLLKRRIREAYRLNKSHFHLNNKQINIAFIYINDQLADYTNIEKAMQKAARILGEKAGTK